MRCYHLLATTSCSSGFTFNSVRGLLLFVNIIYLLLFFSLPGYYSISEKLCDRLDITQLKIMGRLVLDWVNTVKMV